MKLEESNVVVQKQVKQKILQAQQEEALFVKTSSALQSKMERVEQQLSMNGYHIGHHVRNNSMNGNTIISNPKCPMDLPEVAHKPPQPPPNPIKPPSDADIASSYFQSKFGNGEQQQNGNKQSFATSHRSASVDHSFNRSNTQTPERDLRASSQAPTSNSRRPSFSYLSLLPKDGSFPHRTQPIGDPQTKRRGSSTMGSQEHLNNFAKPNLMVRSNPIGLAEPSVKRDGYAVGKDGSFYRSSEHLFENKVSESSSSWKDQRRSSTSSTGSNSNIRVGGGLIETGKPVVQSFLPFGSTKGPNYVIKKGSGARSRSQSKAPKPQVSVVSATAVSQAEISSSSSTSSLIQHNSTSTLSSMSSQTLMSSSSCSTMTKEECKQSCSSLTSITFKELDIALKKVAKEQRDSSDSLNHTEVTLPASRGRKARSLSRNNTETLPDEVSFHLKVQLIRASFILEGK